MCSTSKDVLYQKCDNTLEAPERVHKMFNKGRKLVLQAYRVVAHYELFKKIENIFD